jgi:hypothetical protein
MKHLNLFNSNSEYELYKNSSQYVTPEVSLIEETNTVFYVPKQGLYEWVDLGLPSGMLWADRNVSAEKPEEYGLYFAWGETQGYSGITDTKKFYWSDYKFHTYQSNQPYSTFRGVTKYNTDSSKGTVDNLTVLEQVDDAAYQSDNTCRMPTKDEYQELLDNTTPTWETLNGVNGWRFTSNINGNSIFLPATGTCNRGLIAGSGSFGYYWSSSLLENDPKRSWMLYFNTAIMEMSGNSREVGFPIRPVKSK